ncbi:MAG: protein-glutamate O-methyltransferase CheR [Anaerolineaceae bacterium]|nr:protein-glutamate O-methyltransferase CheR [Anaerolineaceae bacterium]
MEAEIYTLVKASVKKIYNIDLSYYKDEQMKRRLDSWLARSRQPTWNDYFHFVKDNPVEQDRFRNYLTINVTEFFRDPDRWAMLRKDIIPELMKDNGQLQLNKGLRVWSAGCSIGVEAYTLTILLDEIAAGRSHYLLASDMDRGALQKAKARGPYNPDEVRNLSVEQKLKYLMPGPPYFVKEAYAKRITYKEQDLLNDRFETGFDLIVCRNVIIYFTNEAKAMLYDKFFAALRPGGILFLGGTEIIPRPTEIGFRNHGISFYLKA